MRVLAVLGLLILAGCAKPMEVSSITNIKPTEAGAGFDIYDARRLRGEQVPEFAGDQIVEVRTYETTSENGRTEMGGANCVISAAGFNAEAVTPAKVRVPLYRQQSGTISVQCSKPGYKPRMVETRAFDETRQQRYAAGAGNGVLGFVAAAAIDAMSDNTQNPWKYPPVQIDMERETVQTAAR